jgi:outer membrane protein assembly factor BamB
MDVLIDLDTRPLPAPGENSAPLRLPTRLLVLVGLLLTLLVPGSAPTWPLPVQQMFTLPVAPNPEYFVEGGVLFVVSGSAVAAYQLPDGRLRWRTPLNPSVNYTFVNRPAGTMTVALGHDGSSLMTVLDLATGAPLWQRAGLGDLLDAGLETSVFVGSPVVVVDPGEVDVDVPQQLSAVAARTGQPRWQRQLPDSRTGWEVVPARRGVPDVLLGVRTGPDGVTAVRVEVDTGATLGSADLAAGRPELAAAGDRHTVGVLDGTLLLVANTDNGPRAYAYDTTTLALRWTTRLTNYSQYAAACGRYVCFSGDNQGLTLVDLATGALGATGPWQFAAPLPDGRLLAESGTMTVIDDALRPVLPLAEWQVVTAEPVTVLTRQSLSGDRIWVGVLEAGAVRVRPLRRVDISAVDSCVSDGVYLVCRAAPGLVAFRL